MDTIESLGYLKGLLDGLDLDENKKETKVFKAIINVLDNLCEDIDDVYDEIEDIEDEIDSISDDLSDIEDVVYDDDDEWDDDFEDYEEHEKKPYASTLCLKATESNVRTAAKNLNLKSSLRTKLKRIKNN